MGKSGRRRNKNTCRWLLRLLGSLCSMSKLRLFPAVMAIIRVVPALTLIHAINRCLFISTNAHFIWLPVGFKMSNHSVSHLELDWVVVFFWFQEEKHDTGFIIRTGICCHDNRRGHQPNTTRARPHKRENKVSILSLGPGCRKDHVEIMRHWRDVFDTVPASSFVHELLS